MQISLSEIIVILLVALVVIKPEQLPDVLLTMKRLVMRLRLIFANFKRAIEEPFTHSSDHERK